MNRNLRFNSPAETPAACKAKVPIERSSRGTGASALVKRTPVLPGVVKHFLYFCSIVFFSVPALHVNAQVQAVQWNGLNGGSFSNAVSHVYGNLSATSFRFSSNWDGPGSTSNINNSDNYMSNAADPKGNRNTWASIAKTPGIGGAYSDSGFVEFKVSPTAGNSFQVTLVQFSAIMNSGGGDDAGRLAVYYSVDDDATSFGNRTNLGTATLKLITDATVTSGSSVASPIQLQNHQDLTSRRSLHAGEYSFSPNIMVNSGQTLTLRIYAWNPDRADKYLNLRNVVISNTATWPPQELTTAPITSIMPTSVVAGGTIISNGGFPLDETGFSWTTKDYITPSRNDRDGIFMTSPLVSSGSYSGTITGLTPATTYYLRAYANNITGSAYGELRSFTTADSITKKPTVTTATPSNVGSAAATSGGNISNNGGGLIKASGILYSSTLSTSETLILGSGATTTTENVLSGSYTSQMTGLSAGTTYYVRAYASNNDSTGYGAVLSFTTSLVDITTTTPSNVSANKATTGGTITPNGGGTITASGVVASTLQNPTLLTPGAIITEEDSTSGPYTSILTGLSGSTTYYVRAYAVIGSDTVYASQKSFTTGKSPQVVLWSGLNVANYAPAPTTVLGSLKAWDLRISSGWMEAGTPSRQNINFTDNYLDKATTTRGQRNTWVLMDKTEGAGSVYNDSNFVEYKVTPTSGSFNVSLVQFSAVFNGVAGDTSGRMAVYYSIDNDTASFGNAMNLGTASLLMHDGSKMTMNSSIASPIKLQSAGTIAQTRISPHAGDYSFMPNLTVNDGQTLTIRVYAWSATAPDKALAIRNMVISNGTSWPPQELAPTMVNSTTPTTATLSSNILTDGGYPVIASGFAHTTLTYYAPGVNDRQGSITSTATSGPFSGTFTGLTPATTYYARAYATTMHGTDYGRRVMFTTGDSITAKPTVTTTTATNVGSASATSGGNITNNGGGLIIASGVLYSTTLSDTGSLKVGSGASFTTENATSGSYVSQLTGLAAGTTYYVRAYATNSDSTGYGKIDTFTTKLVDITTTTPSNISATGANTGGTITPNGGGTITASGVVASTIPNPTLLTPGAIITSEDSTSGPYTSILSGLSGSTTYYVRAYAVIGSDTVYATQKSFTTSKSPQVVTWNGLNIANPDMTPTTVLGSLKAWDMRYSNSWLMASPDRQSVNFTDNYMDKATTVRAQRNFWALVNKNVGVGSAYSDSNFVEYKVTPTSGTFNISFVQFSAIFNGVAGDTSGRMAVYYSIDNDTSSFGNVMNLGTANLLMHDGSLVPMSSSIASPIKLQSAGTIAQTRISPHAGDYSFMPNLTVNTGQTLTIRVYAWSATAPEKSLAIRNMVISNGTSWPPQELSPTMVSAITPRTATVSSNIITDGGYPVIASGFAYTTLTYYAPGVNDRQGSITSTATSGPFSGTFTGLTPATTYYARAYATTMHGTDYGKRVTFTTADSITAKPTITTTTPSNVGSATATTGGNITNNGGGVIVASGVLYSTTLSTNETLVVGSGASATNENVESGSFTTFLAGLAPGTTYYVRAYASNSDSTGYGAVMMFTTKLVDLTTAPVINITSTSATAGGTITPNGGGTITASGVVVSTIPNPSLVTPGAIITSENDTSGSYTSDLTGLSPSTTYYVRAYAIIGTDTTYGAQVSFTTTAILPLKLVTFTALPLNDAVVVKWTTAAEERLKGFEVERSTTGTGFTVVSGLVAPGLGSYSFTDRTVTTGGYYYRLKSIDIDGTITYSSVVYVSFDVTKLTLGVYPNPASSTINLSHPAAVHGSTVRIINLSGRVVSSTTLKTGNTLTNLNISNLPAGAYMIVVDDHRNVLSTKFIKN